MDYPKRTRVAANGPHGIEKIVSRYSYYAYLLENEKTAADLARAKRGNFLFLPRYLHFYTTFRCNGRCVMCDNWKRNVRNELSADELEPIFRSELFSRLKLIKLTGGEMFERPDYIEIIRMFSEVLPGSMMSLSSNGFPAGRVLRGINKILEIRDDIEVSFSLDGFGKTHDTMRGVSGAFGEVMKSIRGVMDLKESFPNLSLRLSFTITPHNVRDFGNVLRFAKENGIYIGYRFADNGYQYNNNGASFEYGDDENRSVLEQLNCAADNAFKENLSEWFVSGRKPLECFALFSTIYMDTYGNIHTCLKRGPIKSMVGKDPLEIWKSLSKEREGIRGCAGCYTDCQAIPDMMIEGRAVKQGKPVPTLY